jgi:hypothetical protein
MRSSLLFGTLSFSPRLLVVSHRPPSLLGSTVRSRPYVPLRNCWTPVRAEPVICARYSRAPRRQAM